MAKRNNSNGQATEAPETIETIRTIETIKTIETIETIENLEPIEESLETPETPESLAQVLEEPKADENPVKASVVGTDPVQVELKTEGAQNTLNPATSSESIQASIQEKLSRKTDEGAEDPFVPNTQLDNEVKQVAQNNGFPLSRGTEVGARLMARAKRIS